MSKLSFFRYKASVYRMNINQRNKIWEKMPDMPEPRSIKIINNYKLYLNLKEK